MPVLDDDDTVEVFALKKPVWSFKYGPLMGYFVSLIHHFDFIPDSFIIFLCSFKAYNA